MLRASLWPRGQTKGGKGMPEWMRTLRFLSWLTQAGVSVAAPLVLCIGGGLWLYQRFSLGSWVIILAVVLGIGGAACSLATFFRAVQREAEKPGRRRSSFNR